MVIKRRHCCVKVTSSCNLASQHLPELMNENVKFNGEQENKSIICVRRKIRHEDHHLASVRREDHHLVAQGLQSDDKW